ncbi:Prephenate dehydratase-domain-containing protein [Neohortaea acidophila]|uniref:prephenate dehydratase n=1 Tax=Neohortaea acidophila TaxID=245834 RepID=A0A6A6PWS1_9PEZI|nr:Prephenate dehydratase-domain-containing protein [Neohortaea acidophila]KAF2484482.1 Prephenate dehydratase-domain-containing protein [Neohortaea acidophila]
MDTAREKGNVVAFLGPKASYTHQATLQKFGDQNFHIVPMTSIDDVFAAVQAGSATHGVVPFENSSNGPVLFTLDLFADADKRHPDIVVEAEIYLPVHHCLVGQRAAKALHTAKATDAPSLSQVREDLDTSPVVSGAATPTQTAPQPARPRVQPLHSIKHIQHVHSHPQAWGQCKAFLTAYLKQAEKHDVSSTSRAAEIVATDSTGVSAAVSSKLAAELNGLDVLAEGIEDTQGNSTRFFVLRRRQDVEGHVNASSTEGVNGPVANAHDDQAQLFKSLISFTVDHAEPGALADSLAVFKKHGLNLTSINTRPSGARPWNYVFFVELMGRKRGDGDGGKVNVALDELGRVVKTYRWLGSWEKMTKD